MKWGEKTTWYNVTGMQWRRIAEYIFYTVYLHGEMSYFFSTFCFWFNWPGLPWTKNRSYQKIIIFLPTHLLSQNLCLVAGDLWSRGRRFDSQTLLISGQTASVIMISGGGGPGHDQTQVMRCETQWEQRALIGTQVLGNCDKPRDSRLIISDTSSHSLLCNTCALLTSPTSPAINLYNTLFFWIGLFPSLSI